MSFTHSQIIIGVYVIGFVFLILVSIIAAMFKIFATAVRQVHEEYKKIIHILELRNIKF